MARSAHAYVRGNALKFYEWLAAAPARAVPRGPAVWICGDCHIGNLGPLASAKGHVDVQIRDLDQTVIGNPAHDLIRLGLSLATAARGSDLPGVITAKMLEQMIGGYEKALESGLDEKHEHDGMPKLVHRVVRLAVRRTWPQLATERIEDTRPMIPVSRSVGLYQRAATSRFEARDRPAVSRRSDGRRPISSLGRWQGPRPANGLGRSSKMVVRTCAKSIQESRCAILVVDQRRRAGSHSRSCLSRALSPVCYRSSCGLTSGWPEPSEHRLPQQFHQRVPTIPAAAYIRKPATCGRG